MDDRLLLRGLISNPPVPMQTVNELPNHMGALYDHDQRVIFVLRGMTADDIFRSVSKELAHAELIWLNDMGMLGNAELAITRKGKGSVVNQCRLAERRNLCVAMGFCISGHRCSLFDRAEGMAHRA